MEGLGMNVPKSLSGLLSFSRESVSASLSRAEASLGLKVPNAGGVPNSAPNSAGSSSANSSAKPSTSIASSTTTNQRSNNPSR